jgi:hypothetical protein
LVTASHIYSVQAMRGAIPKADVVALPRSPVSMIRGQGGW